MGSDPPSGPSIIEQRIDYNRLGALRSQLHIYTQQKFTHVPPLGCLAAVTTEITAAKETRGACHLVKNSEKFRFGAKWRTFFRFARPENSQKKWNYWGRFPFTKRFRKIPETSLGNAYR